LWSGSRRRSDIREGDIYVRRRSRKEGGERVFRPWRRSVEIPCQIERRVLRACKKEEDKEGRQPKKEVAWRGQARRVDSEGWRETSEREDRGRVLWIRACFEMEMGQRVGEGLLERGARSQVSGGGDLSRNLLESVWSGDGIRQASEDARGHFDEHWAPNIWGAESILVVK
jgi:hypothetical protein